MHVRQPIVAGSFYPDGAMQCRRALHACIARAVASDGCPGRLLGGIVPHAGWMCSGHVAAAVFRALSAAPETQTIVMFGAVHRWPGARAAVCRAGAWESPLGTVRVADDLADELFAATDLLVDAAEAHREEHSLEVQMPFVKHFFPHARVLPVMVPPNVSAVELGQVVGSVLAARAKREVIIGTTDLTHYGPSYGFTPHGVGDAGLRWAREVNDRRMIDLITSLAADAIVGESQEHRNACGSGALAATVAALRRLGAERAYVLEHTTSREVLGLDGDDAVGYLGAVFGSG